MFYIKIIILYDVSLKTDSYLNINKNYHALQSDMWSCPIEADTRSSAVGLRYVKLLSQILNISHATIFT
jgi:hypothetical protein